jgi:pSer/pThr/pTyr-binding forkhead associated (FHA) protein
MKAWIEKSDGTRVTIEGNCYFGRSPANTVPVQSPGASRRHAHVHAQESDGIMGFWLADLGSTNGTLRNGKRVTIPARLNDGDIITILEDNFTFRTDEELQSLSSHSTDSPATVVVRSNQLCWLLMLDIKKYTVLARELDTDTLSLKVGTWLRQCRDAIEGAGGVVDKFLGDAIFAYWKQGPKTPEQVGQTLKQLVQFQRTRDPDFRLVLHYAPVTLAGGAGGDNNLSGPDVIYVFRMEKVCAGLTLDSIISEPARAALPASCKSESVGSHPLDGFPGTHLMHKLAE